MGTRLHPLAALRFAQEHGGFGFPALPPGDNANLRVERREEVALEDELTKLTRELLDLKAEKKKEMKNYSDLIKAKERGF